MTDPALEAPSAGHFVDGAHRLPVRVYYEDTDAGGIVYHASYLRFFERGRTEMLVMMGAGRGQAGEGGYVVAELAIRYLRPARLGDALVVSTRVTRVRITGCVVQQRVTRASGRGDEPIAEGEVTLALIGADGRPRRQPAAWVEAFRALEGACSKA